MKCCKHCGLMTHQTSECPVREEEIARRRYARRIADLRRRGIAPTAEAIRTQTSHIK